MRYGQPAPQPVRFASRTNPSIWRTGGGQDRPAYAPGLQRDEQSIKFGLCNQAFSFNIEGLTFSGMDASTSLPATAGHHDPHAHAGEHEHHELGWWRKYIFSTDHKVIGIQYGLCGLAFLFFGFSLMMIMRWQFAYPGQALPVIGKWLPHIFGPGSMPDGKRPPDFYNSLGAMHGTIMIFAGVVPL